MIFAVDMAKLFLCLTVVAVLPAGAAQPPPAPPPEKPPEAQVNYRDPPRQYETYRLAGWTVQVERQLVAEAPELAKRALARLESKLGVMLAALPKHAHPLLRKAPIYLMYGSRAKGGGHDRGASYHQKDAPKRQKNLDPRWQNCVVIYSAANYVRLSELWAVKVLVHEFAHAFHLQQWPERQPDIYQAWANAMRRGLYRDVLDERGRKLDRGYAAVNQLEYFAELSCMYFVGCNYQPVGREQLRDYDPAGYAMIRKMWDLEERAAPLRPVQIPRRGEGDPAGRSRRAFGND
jgi:hypothetical protein